MREFREKAPQELRARRRLPWIIRKLPLPGSPPMSVGYLTDTTLVRDWWIHRLDLCHATGQAVVLTPEHDGRLTALVVRDVARRVTRALHGGTVDLVLTGPAGGRYRFGTGAPAEAVIAMATLDFHLRASERISPQEAFARARVRGQAPAARRVLELATTLY